MAGGASLAAGERSVSVGGDVVGSLIVTGDNNNLNLVLGEAQGALLEQLARKANPVKRLRPAPVRSVPPEFSDSLDRDQETRAILDALASGTPINLHGPRGIGKTYAVLRALNADSDDRVVYLYAPGPLDDVLQLMFEAWYECDPPFKPSTSQLRASLGQVGGLVTLDSVALERDTAQQVLLSATGCQVIVVSRERVLFSGTALSVEGLEPGYAVKLVELELGRELADSERGDAVCVCVALQGHPLKVREAVATMRDAGRSLRDLAAELSAGEPESAVARDKLLAAGGDGRALMAALALFDGATLGKDHLRAIADVDDFEAALAGALGRRDLRSHSPRYNLGATLDEAVADMDLRVVGARALAHFHGWVLQNRSRPGVLMTEGGALVALLRWAVDAGRLRPAIELGRTVDHAFALERKFGAWGEVLECVHTAALAAHDRHSEAWALHQLGTRAVCLGELAAGSAMLGQALELRREIGDTEGATRSARNLSMATHPKWLWRWVVGHSLLVVVVVALVAGGAVAAATLPGGGTSGRKAVVPAAAVHSSRVGHLRSPRGSRFGGIVGAATPKKNLTITISGPGSVAVSPGKTCSQSCTLSEPIDSGATLIAQPGQGARFSGWSGACSTPDAACNTVMNSDQSVAATFTATVSLTVNLPDGGSVTSDKGKIDCPRICSDVFPAGTSVTLTASGLAFWTGAPGCAQAPASSTTTSSSAASANAVPPTAAAAPPRASSNLSSGASPSCSITLDSSLDLSVAVAPG